MLHIVYCMLVLTNANMSKHGYFLKSNIFYSMNESGAFLFSFQVAKQRPHHRTVVLMRSLGVLQFQEDRQEKSTKFNSWLLN